MLVTGYILQECYETTRPDASQTVVYWEHWPHYQTYVE